MNKIKTITTAALIGTIGLGTHALMNNYVDAATLMKTTATVNLRTGPGIYYKSLGYVAEGLEVGVTSFTSNGWAKLENGNYVSGKYLIKANNNNNNNKSIYLYTKNNLNLRTNAGTGYNIIMTMPKGSKVTYLTESNGWAKVNYGKYTGWCSKQYLSNTPINTNNNQTKTFINKIYIDKNNHMMYCYSNGLLIKSMPCATGKKSTPTPSGTFKVIDMVKNRPYYKKGIPGGASNNPLGPRFIQLTTGGIAIHGNCNESSIGKSVSDGCIRLHNSDVEWLFDRVAEYKTIVIIY